MPSLPESQLIQRIQEEFKDEGMPEPVLHQLKSYRSPGYEGEDEKFCQSLICRSWTDVPPEVFAAFSPNTVFSLLPQDVWEYFLPAFIVAVLNDSISSGESIFNFVNTLMPIQPRGEPMRLAIRKERFTDRQLQCLVDFLKWCGNDLYSSEMKIHRRIQRFWDEHDHGTNLTIE